MLPLARRDLEYVWPEVGVAGTEKSSLRPRPNRTNGSMKLQSFINRYDPGHVAKLVGIDDETRRA